MVELADEMDGTVEGEEVAMAMVADIHPVATVGAVAIDDVKLPKSEVGLLGPKVRHDVDLPVVRASCVLNSRPPHEGTREPLWLLATCSAVVK